MGSPSVVSNGTEVREDETEVLAGSREVALCLPIDLGSCILIPPDKRINRKSEVILHISGNPTYRELGLAAGLADQPALSMLLWRTANCSLSLSKATKQPARRKPTLSGTAGVHAGKRCLHFYVAIGEKTSR